ncbi:hypothetical protein K504DRAFT_10256 [Pleomassaria siparia CBS 279.74]|uniref:Uncharacterized protein n=1 Tax=Pleomassaria siparia CBS 279.74 TaxID=1314801 RepID=A0A6G1KPF1_9PLEO|nr:hypothetical protein K504DRAFT_10256 [Pleomassaria siparia CBS 279.74]
MFKGRKADTTPCRLLNALPLYYRISLTDRPVLWVCVCGDFGPRWGGGGGRNFAVWVLWIRCIHTYIYICTYETGRIMVVVERYSERDDHCEQGWKLAIPIYVYVHTLLLCTLICICMYVERALTLVKCMWIPNQRKRRERVWLAKNVWRGRLVSA